MRRREGENERKIQPNDRERESLKRDKEREVSKREVSFDSFRFPSKVVWAESEIASSL